MKDSVKEKLINQELYSEKHKIHGKLDEILILEDGRAVSLDYKYAEYKETIFSTYKTQAIMYSMLIQDNLGLKSDHA